MEKQKIKILVIGSGAREHALVWKILQSSRVEKVYCAPGNAGISLLAECVNIKADDFKALENFVLAKNIDLTVVGPEAPLDLGITDYFVSKKLRIFGPNKSAARLESSKVFAKNIMRKYSIPTAAFSESGSWEEARKFIENWNFDKKLVIKADGLAAGKGVLICARKSEAEEAIDSIMKKEVFGSAGKRVVLEEFLEGEEASLQIFLDSKNYSVMVPAQDHKRVNDNDEGLNTGGMGAYAPAPVVDGGLLERVRTRIIVPLIEGLRKEGIDYRGVLYIGLMIVEKNPFVIEFNCRFGDPETQVVLPLLKTDLVDVMESVIDGGLDKKKIEWYNSTAVCVVLASGGYPGEFKKGYEIEGLLEAGKLKDVLVFHAGTTLKDSNTITSGGRVLGITGIGKDVQEAVGRAYEGVGKIKFDLMHYRKDIAQRALKRL